VRPVERAPYRHAPATHACPPAHAVAHAPQWSASVARSAHLSPQSVSPTAHDATQYPREHRSPTQRMPHPPQCALVVTSVSHPLVGSPSQSA
jgi:hypothetical protein